MFYRLLYYKKLSASVFALHFSPTCRIHRKGLTAGWRVSAALLTGVSAAPSLALHPSFQLAAKLAPPRRLSASPLPVICANCDCQFSISQSEKRSVYPQVAVSNQRCFLYAFQKKHFTLKIKSPVRLSMLVRYTGDMTGS